jgi:chromosome partitioning protein
MITVIGNLKGGSGKSTVAFNLAVWLALQNRPATLLDLDPQRTLSDLVAVRAEEGFEPALELMPVDTDIASLRAPGAADVLIDVGASSFDRMIDAIRHADAVLIPVVPGQADVWSTQRYLKIVQGERRPDCRVMLFLNRTDALGGSKETREASVALNVLMNMLEGVTVLTTRLGQRIGFCRSLSEGLAVFELDPKSKASIEFMDLAAAIAGANAATG